MRRRKRPLTAATRSCRLGLDDRQGRLRRLAPEPQIEARGNRAMVNDCLSFDANDVAQGA
jgi:hypothetical protein